MFNPKNISELANKLLDSLPPGAKKLPEDIQKNFRALLMASFEKMDLVTREEFDTQQKVLLKTRQKIEALEKQLDEMSKKKK